MPIEADPSLYDFALTALADAKLLVSWWKPVLLLAPLAVWGWFVSSVMDKHATRFHLPRKKWNLIHLIVATISLVLAFMLPVPGLAGFFAGFGAITIILFADIMIFMALHNRDDRVPEEHLLRLDFSELAAKRDAKKSAKEAGTVQLKIVNDDGETASIPEKETPEYEIRAQAEISLIQAVDMRASRFEIGPLGGEGGYAITAIVDGLKQGIEQMPAQQAVKLIDFWKSSAGLDVQDRRRKQRGEITASKDDIWHHQVRMDTIGGQAGPKLTFTFNPTKAVTRKYEDVGFFESQDKALDEIRGTTGGLILVAAAPGNGLTSSTYALVGKHDPYTSIVQTVEFDVQAPIEGVMQNKFDQSGDAEYSTTVRSILRRDPDVVGVTDFRDPETAKEIVRADLKRSKVYLSIKADNALIAVQTLVKHQGSPEESAEALVGVTAQKLARRLCSNCRVPYSPDAGLLKKLGLPADKVKQLFKKGGQVLIKNKPEICPMCSGSGYFGQVAFIEVFPIGDAERAMIKEQNWNGLRGEFRKRQLPTIQQAGLRRVVEGATSLEEFSRVTAAPAKAKAPATKAPPKPKDES
jgi:type II secretory ATPase GspE/PulE/Tfp pilus assembly ATPase PilB-like protein